MWRIAQSLTFATCGDIIKICGVEIVKKNLVQILAGVIHGEYAPNVEL